MQRNVKQYRKGEKTKSTNAGKTSEELSTFLRA